MIFVGAKADAWGRKPIFVAWGVGSSLSHLSAAAIVVAAGYDTAFLSLAAVAGAGFVLYLLVMPETGPPARINRRVAVTTAREIDEGLPA